MIDSAAPERATYTRKEVERILGMSETAVLMALRRGDIPSVRVGRRWLIPKAALANMLASADRKPVA